MADTKISALPASTTPLAGTEVLPIVQGGATKQVSVTNLTSGKVVPANGILFPATQVASADANTLDDYEEGTWTPTLLTSGTNFTSVTYDAATGGRYTKIGNVVHIQGYIRTDAVTVGSASGDVLIGNLPFTSVANSGAPVNGNSSVAVSRTSDWAVNQPSAARVNANSTRIELYTRLTANGASSNMAVADVGTGADDNTIYFAGTYVAA